MSDRDFYELLDRYFALDAQAWAELTAYRKAREQLTLSAPDPSERRRLRDAAWQAKDRLELVREDLAALRHSIDEELHYRLLLARLARCA